MINDYMLEELKIIQNTIQRMANNSFNIKGWTITLVAATLLLKGSTPQVYISLIPTIMFWYLDAYFLHQERLYRKLYEWVVSNRSSSKDYSFDMNAYRFKGEVQSVIRIMISKTILTFYGSIVILIGLYVVVVCAWYKI